MRTLSIAAMLFGALFIAGLAISSAVAGSGAGPGDPDCPNFVDEDGDGVNDDCTGDGTRPQDGTGRRRGLRRGGSPGGPNSIDEDEDGISDNCPNNGTRPQDGSGAKRKIRGRRSDDSGNGEANGTRSRSRDGSGSGTGRKNRRTRRR
jgi:hypothetical protein